MRLADLAYPDVPARAVALLPLEATAAEGEQTFETLTELLVELVREVARS